MTSRASVSRGKRGGKRRTLATRVERLERKMSAQEKREMVRDHESAVRFANLEGKVNGLDTRLGLLVEKVSNIQSVTRDTWECMDKIREGQERGFNAVHERLNTLGCAPEVKAKEADHA